MQAASGISTGQWRSWQDEPWPELPDQSRLQAWVYTDQPSYEPGDPVAFHACTTASAFTLTVIRDGSIPGVVAEIGPLPGAWHSTPVDAPSRGCDWPVAAEFTIPGDWPSGGYVVVIEARDGDRTVVQEGFFAVRSRPESRAPITLVLSTYTWNAYNDWGGASSYSALADRWPFGFSPTLSLRRPWGRGFIRCPVGVPRFGSVAAPPIGWAVRHEWAEWAYANGYARWAASAGWARFDGLMARWLGEQGIDFDVITQWDLDRDVEALTGTNCVVTCGHDEYWTSVGRQRLAAFLDNGGSHARFGGNILWQVRADWVRGTTECYKFREELDPMRDGPSAHRTGAFEGITIADPPFSDFGGSGIRGTYAGWGGNSPRGQRGFVVYRPRHWAFEGTDTYFADVVGGESSVVTYESDGVDFGFRYGLPYPTGDDGCPPELEILALTPTTLEEEDHGNPGSVFDPLDNDLGGITRLLLGEDTPENRDRLRYGAAMITSLRRGRGEVFCAGSTEWPFALDRGDRVCQIITRNVLRRFAERQPS